MNRPARLSIVEALQGAVSPIAKYPFRFECGCCGREDFGNGPPYVVACIGCGAEVTAKNNPPFPSRLTFQVAE